MKRFFHRRVLWTRLCVSHRSTLQFLEQGIAQGIEQGIEQGIAVEDILDVLERGRSVSSPQIAASTICRGSSLGIVQRCKWMIWRPFST